MMSIHEDECNQVLKPLEIVGTRWVGGSFGVVSICRAGDERSFLMKYITIIVLLVFLDGECSVSCWVSIAVLTFDMSAEMGESGLGAFLSSSPVPAYPYEVVRSCRSLEFEAGL